MGAVSGVGKDPGHKVVSGRASFWTLSSGIRQVKRIKLVYGVVYWHPVG